MRQKGQKRAKSSSTRILKTQPERIAKNRLKLNTRHCKKVTKKDKFKKNIRNEKSKKKS